MSLVVPTLIVGLAAFSHLVDFAELETVGEMAMEGEEMADTET